VDLAELGGGSSDRSDPPWLRTCPRMCV